MGKIFDDDDLEKEHGALQHMADIMARKWKGDLEEKECCYTVDGIISQFEIWEEDIDALKILYDLHKKRIKEYREKKNGK